MKYDKWWMRFMDEPDDNGGGAAVFDVPAKTTTGDLEPPETKVEDDEPAKVEPVAPTATVDIDALTQKFGQVIGEQFKKKADDEKPSLTPEEAEKILNVWKPTKEWLAKYNNLDTQEEAVREMRDGFVKHIDTIGQHRLKELETKFEEKYSPIIEQIQRMNNEQRETRFNTQFPQLAKPALKPLLEAVAQDLVSKGKKFDDESSMFTAIASGAEAVIKETNPDFKLTAGSTPAPQKKATNSIPVTTPGAGGSAAAKGAAPEPKKGLAVFSK